MSRPPTPTFGELLQAHRTAAGLTQEALAERSGLSARGISDLERGLKLTPHRDTVRRLIDALALGDPAREAMLEAARRRPAAPARTAKAPVWRLATPPVPLLGRARELRDVTALLRDPDVRLLTLTGTGGTGKTRLALEVATGLVPDFSDGVHFASLAAIVDPSLVAATIAQALEMSELAGSLLDMEFPERDLLLVLDNFEQVLPAAGLVAHVLDSTPRLKILVTSRAPLGLTREREYPVHPFPLPVIARSGSSEGLLASEAVQLFIQRARAVQPTLQLSPANLETIARICARLDGLPLAIELAAARSKLLSPDAILTRLDHRLSLLTHGPVDAPPRHQTLRSAMSWSYDLLDVDTQRLFRRLAVFAGGFTLDAATAIMAFDHPYPTEFALLDALAMLVDRSVLIREDQDDGEPRFRMLETLREFGIEQMHANGDLEPVRWAHFAYYAGLVDRAEPELTGSRQREWFDTLELELPNLRMALDWAVAQQAEAGLAMAGGLGRFWDHRSHLQEGLHWFSAVLEMSGDFPPYVRAKALWGQGVLAFTIGDYAGAEAILREGVTVARAAGDRYHHAFCVNDLGSVALRQGDIGGAQVLFRESLGLMRELEDHDGIAAVLGNLSYAALLAGDGDEAIGYGEASMDLYRELGSDHGQASMMGTLGRSLVDAGRVDEAEEMLADGLGLSIELGKYGYVAACLVGLAAAAASRHDVAYAATLLGVLDEFTDTTHVALAPLDRDWIARYRSRARTALGDVAYHGALTAGRLLSPEDVLAGLSATVVAEG